MHEQRVLARTEDAQPAESLDERLRAERKPGHRPVSAAGRGAADGLVDDGAPLRQVGVQHAEEAGVPLGSKLRAAAGNGQGGFERVPHGAGVEIDFAGHGLDDRRFSVCRR